MRNLTFAFTILFLVFGRVSYTQMEVQGQIRYGNEWIDYNKEYLKLKVAEDGIYRLSYGELLAAGIDPSELIGDYIKIYHLGEEVALLTTNTAAWTANDYLEFYGKKNRVELDKYLFEDWEDEMLNTEYSMFNDTSAYFLTLDQTPSTLRYTQKSNDLAGNLPNATDHYLHTEQKVFSSDHNKPLIQGLEVKYSSFVEAEGYGSNRLSNHTISLDTPNKVDGDGEAYAYVRLGSNNPTFAHRLTGTVNNSSLGFQTWSGSKVRVFEGKIALNDIEDKTEINLTSEAGSNSKTQVSVARITYPRSFDFSGASSWAFDLPQSNFSRYIEIINFNNTIAPVLYDHVNHEFHIGNTETGVLRYLIGPKQNKSSFILIGSNDGYKSPADISSKTFIDFSNVNPNFMMLTSKAMDQTINGQNVVQEYAEYRRSDLGGNYDVEIVHQDEIYDQFAYGVDRHNIANRNFAHYIENVWTSLDYWYVVGKGQEYNLVRTNEDNLSNAAVNHVSPFGQPGSDMLNVCSRGTADPKFLIGRIAAKDQDELADYFEKVKQHDDLSYWDQTIEGKAWMKKVIHLSGGDPDIQQGIFNFLERMRDTLENNRFGADVTTFRKYSSDNVETSLSQEIKGLIDDGTSIVTFFGHSAVGTLDFSLEDVSQYTNYRKYPMIISLGCFSGNVHSNARGLSEDFVLEPEKGSIAFLAASSTAYVSTQGRSGTDFYSNLGGEFYGSSLGALVNQIYKSNKSSTTPATRSLMHQLTLHGDPAVKLNSHDGVDYTVDKQSVSVNPSIVSTNSDSFSLNFDVFNIGYHRAQELEILVQHRGPTGDILYEILDTIPSPPNRTTLTLTIPTPDPTQLGKNSIEIVVDPNNKIEEIPTSLAESNNRLTELTNGEGFCFYILDNGLNTVYPYDFSIVSESCPFELKASTNNALIKEQTYVFEIDTTTLFNSPILETGRVTQSGGLINYTPSIEKVDNRIYYWRVSPDSTDANVGYLWKEASFTYDKDGQEGWNQGHYYQFLKNDLSNHELLDNRKFDVPDEYFDMLMNIRVPDGDVVPRLFQNGTTSGKMKLWEIPFDGIGVALKRLENFTYIENTIPGEYGSYTQAGTQRIFFFKTDNAEDRISLVNFLEDQVDSGDHVFLFTVTNTLSSNLNVDDWALDSLSNNNRNIFNTLEKQGAQNIRDIASLGTVPYGIFYSKDTGVRDEKIGSDISSVISLNSLYSRNISDGSIKTTIIKESQNWNSLEWKLSDQEDQDSVYVNVYAVEDNNTETLVYEREMTSPLSLENFNETSVSAIIVEFVFNDELNKTSPQIDYVRVTHTPRADLSINTNDDRFSFKSDTLTRGELLELQLPIYNYTNTDFNNCKAKISIVDAQNNETIEEIEIDAIAAKSSYLLEWKKETTNLDGLYQWTIDINYEKNPMEQYYFNNIGVGNFYIDKDEKNPILDLTFDGVHITNGDLVSSKPEIVITSIDDNQFLMLDDPELFEIFIEYPDGNSQNVDLNGTDIQFIAADPSENINKASIIYTPILDQDGTYMLIAQSRDQTGNFAGENAYEITFEVITKNSISNVLNYPNPFSTNTQFVFTVTGDEAPTAMMINIYTLSGKLVRQISPDELGPLHIGHNRTSYKWDGTDEYGDKLANGVYLYKVEYDTNISDNYETYFTEADTYFKNGFSKMVIMR